MILHYIILYYTIQYYAVLSYTMISHTIIHHAKIHYTILFLGLKHGAHGSGCLRKAEEAVHETSCMNQPETPRTLTTTLRDNIIFYFILQSMFEVRPTQCIILHKWHRGKPARNFPEQDDCFSCAANVKLRSLSHTEGTPKLKVLRLASQS